MEVQFKAMGIEHVTQVAEIENLVFSSPWSKQSFVHEMVNNSFAHYLVAVQGDKVIGYGGMWLVIDEAHITNIAIHPEFQGRKIGKNLLSRLIVKAVALGATSMTLEVRESNELAQKLYRELGFQSKGLRKGYYTDTKEDAIIMWLDMQIKGRCQW